MIPLMGHQKPCSCVLSTLGTTLNKKSLCSKVSESDVETRIPQKLPGPILNHKVQKSQGCAIKMANSKFNIIRGKRKAVFKEKNSPIQAAGYTSMLGTFANPGAGLDRNRCEDALIPGADQLQPLLGTHSKGSTTPMAVPPSG